jgi:hypothetical protein
MKKIGKLCVSIVSRHGKEKKDACARRYMRNYR